jgi:periplasmic protein TonB
MTAGTSANKANRSHSRRGSGRRRLTAISSARHAAVPWKSIVLSGASVRPASAGIGQVSRPPVYVWLLVAAALLLHVSGLWYLHYTSAQPVKPKKVELKLDFVQPPPPPPKIDPPKPPPPIRHAQVLPQIQQAAPVTSDVVAPSPEPPVAVAPVAAPAAPTAPPPPLPVTAPFGKAGYLNNPPPDYPAMAARQGWGGTVVLHVHVLSTGKPDQVEIQTTSGHAPLDQEAVRAVKTWSFAPAKRGDSPVDGWATVPIEFKL